MATAADAVDPPLDAAADATADATTAATADVVTAAANAAPKSPTVRVLSKKRFQEIRATAAEVFCEGGEGDGDARLERFMQQFAAIMNFDPTVGTYTPERGKLSLACRKKKAEALGVSVYEACGGKAFYNQHKEARKAQSAQQRQRARLTQST
jgi:hypothetical protein